MMFGHFSGQLVWRKCYAANTADMATFTFVKSPVPQPEWEIVLEKKNLNFSFMEKTCTDKYNPIMKFNETAPISINFWTLNQEVQFSNCDFNWFCLKANEIFLPEGVLFRSTASPILRNQHPSVNSTIFSWTSSRRIEWAGFFRQLDKRSLFKHFLSGWSRPAWQEGVDGWTRYSLKHGQKDVPQIWPNYALFWHIFM